VAQTNWWPAKQQEQKYPQSAGHTRRSHTLWLNARERRAFFSLAKLGAFGPKVFWHAASSSLSDGAK